MSLKSKISLLLLFAGYSSFSLFILLSLSFIFKLISVKLLLEFEVITDLELVSLLSIFILLFPLFFLSFLSTKAFKLKTNLFKKSNVLLINSFSCKGLKVF